VTRRAYGYCIRSESGPCGELLDGLARANEENALKVRILCICMDPTDGDAALSRDFAQSIARRKMTCEIAYYQDGKLPEFLQAMMECSAIVSSRLHGAVVAMLCGVPAFQVEYETKGRELARRCQLSGDFLSTATDLRSDDVARFIQLARAGLLREPLSSDRALLAECGVFVTGQLNELADEIRNAGQLGQGR